MSLTPPLAFKRVLQSSPFLTVELTILDYYISNQGVLTKRYMCVFTHV